MRFCQILAMRLSWVESIRPPVVSTRLTVRSQVQERAPSPSCFLLSRPFSSARHHAKADFSRPTWVDLLYRYFTPHSRECIASAIPLLSHNITSNAKYFTQPTDAPEPLALDWDDESLPEQVAQTGGFDVILYVLHACRRHIIHPPGI